ncbi:polysaccharide deacetylase family protein [Agriterribacter sp.]|uniref:polysaccharide deacetylase family protein n=1 Tax=Agriterribacter sp. TaxID=2821509 RepID=UPI002BBD1C86|nr:polysaccharide deacetylase family protein [Agriterribacter sp.]HRO45773.1 polysaccharide deacetylase family protein [Agriterribacter sp.]HRQ16772.1 polysaccharide deacetylase family protein [Agriterribacter sp.]
MRYSLLMIAFACSSMMLHAQHPPRLIVRGDDMGFSHSGNAAAIKTYKEGIVRSVEVLVPSPWFPEAVALLKENPGVDVGIHLTLTSEWDNVKWRPVSDCPSLKDADGYFYPMIWPNKNYPNRALLQHKWTLEDVEKEFRAQIELAIKKIPRISHVSGHMGCTHMNEDVTALTKKLAKEYKIDIDPSEKAVKGVSYKWQSKTAAEKKKAFIAMLQTLEPGNTYLFVDHPAFDTPEMRAIHHIGYEDVATDRQGVVDIWTDAEIIALIKKKKIQLISYKDLATE